MISTTIAYKGLKEAALEVYHPLQKNDMNEARRKLSYIVGRDTEKLDESEIVRGTVETVAENTSDGVTAPLFWALIGGAPFALLYRAINTCDSMVGYKNDRYLDFGWASARMDDIVNWIPSRLTGFIMLLTNRPQKQRSRLLGGSCTVMQGSIQVQTAVGVKLQPRHFLVFSLVASIHIKASFRIELLWEIRFITLNGTISSR